MYIEQVNNCVNPVSPLFVRTDSMQLDQHKVAFRKIFHQALNNRLNSRPPKIELRGVRSAGHRGPSVPYRMLLRSHPKRVNADATVP